MKALLLVVVACIVSAIAHSQPDQHRYIVAFKKDAMFENSKAVLESLGVKSLLTVPSQNILAAHLEGELLAKVQGLAEVDYVEQDAPRYSYGLTLVSMLRAMRNFQPQLNSSDPQVTPYGINSVQALDVSDDSINNRKVCIIDSGYDGKHEDLQHTNVDGTNDSGSGFWNVDECGHGTHVAGTIAALNNDIGVQGVVRNGKLNLHIIKVFSGADCSYTYSSNLVAAVDACLTVGSNVLSMSLGSAVPSNAEKTAFDNAYAKGVLSVAAAGNGGNTRNSYPASYESVVSVAAVDENNQHASFSQSNANVEISAPGVSVLSTVPMGHGEEAKFIYGSDSSYNPIPLDGSPQGTASGVLFNCGLGASVCACKGAIALIQRGDVNFTFKVQNAEAGGCSAALIYNNVDGSFSGTLNGVTTTIPSVSLSLAEGNSLLSALAANPNTLASLNLYSTNYAYYDGTSMATPHVSAVAALVWSYKPSCPNTVIRSILQSTALRLPSGTTTVPNNDYGYGLVQSLAAKNALLNDNRC